MKKLLLIGGLALRDMLSEKVMALCLIIALAATAAPLLVIAGLRVGLVEGLRTALLEDPRVREISNASNRQFDTVWLQALARQPDIAFVAPRTRTLAASVLLMPQGRPQDARRVELIPSSVGDPLLSPVDMSVEFDKIVLSAPAAASLHAHVGDVLDMHLSRLGEGATQESVPLQVFAVSPPRAIGQNAAFVSVRLAQAVEIFREKPVSWQDAWTSAAALLRTQAGFRLYMKHIEDVPAEDARLRAAGVDVTSRAGDVADLLTLDKRLTLLFRLTACMGVAGFVSSLAAGLWANVERKRLSLATMRFIGVPYLTVFPLLQAQILAFCGSSLALCGAWVVGSVINHQFAQILPTGHPLCIINGRLCMMSLLLTATGALLASLAAAHRAGRIDPWEGISTP
ncbi:MULTISPECIES: hypothetical protein [Acetobacter]|jgi:putative ABC transport system permease protein|uniref:Putative ABC transport system permease protein n=1 Tax=Acetobacter lovaniensis TaxID=104100 RepID=A0A841QHF5_9PROT|nr:hypothetical protein [Acetobacter lovaniensis]MBB6458539.1 putative ABC transport system permease protein [Acetobacter lovaniensis]MCI1795358.1 hypothetical protein [Acetobacter lovaniensis]MCP1240707.1 hypothetical protein [Acetobacter lovaniensis]NHN82740.1 hypothetical protein [Acetobacter lovaniensis]GBQ65258.1 antimicrobial peptide ABC transporter permease [Acetobacter lovaniensis NRIC 0474]